MTRSDRALLARVEQLRLARESPTWKFLRANNGPEVLAILYAEFFHADETQIPVGRFHERLAADISLIAQSGREMFETSVSYGSSWVDFGWLDRIPGAVGAGEVYILTADTYAVLEIVDQIVAPTTSTTSSQITSIMDQLSALAINTDTDKDSRIQAYKEQISAVQAEIDKLESDRSSAPVNDELAAETVRSLLTQTSRSYADFARLRRGIRQAVKNLRGRAIASEGSRGDIIELILGQVDQLESTDYGRSFEAFYQVLSDPVRLTQVEEHIDTLRDRPFAGLLTSAERNALADILTDLAKRAAEVHIESDALSAGLRAYVEQDRFSDERRIDLMAKEMYRMYSQLVTGMSPRTYSGYDLTLPTVAFDSLSRLTLRESDSSLPPLVEGTGEPVFGDWGDVTSLADPDEIDFAGLKAAIAECLEDRTIVTISDVFRLKPETGGLPAIIGLIQIGTERSRLDPPEAQVKIDITENVSWPDSPEFTIPRVSFYLNGAA